MSNKTYFELLLERDGRSGEAEMLAALQQSGIFKHCYAHKSRVKPELKLLEKTVRKKKEKPHYKLQDITDVIGIRFVTLLRSEMPLVFESMIDIVNHTSSLSPNPFLKNRIEEIIVYYTNPNDQILIELNKIVKRKKIKRKIIPRLSKESYSSIHLVTRLNKKIDKLCSNDREYYIPVEVQIRTVFEDAWGEIDHKYGYVIRSGKDAGTPVTNAQSVLRHLKIMKQFSDACAEYADVIHLEATTRDNEVLDKAKVLPVAADDDIIGAFKSLNVNKQHITLYTEARKLRLKAQEEDHYERGNGLILFLQAAQLFREISKRYNIDEMTTENRKDYLFYYYTKMNEALCLLSTNQADSVKIAQSIYEFLDQKYALFPLVKMRLAQTYSKLGLIDESIIKFQESSNMISDFEKKGVVFDDTIPKTDYNHMKIHLPKLYGYCLWCKAEAINDDQQLKEKLKLLQMAYNQTQIALQIAPKNLNLNNNMLYYASEIKKVSDGTKFAHDFSTITNKIELHLKTLEEVCPLETCKDILTLDTLLQAYNLLGKKDEILGILERLAPLIENELSNPTCDQHLILDIQKEASELKKKYEH